MTDTMPVKLSFFAGLIIAIILEFRNIITAFFNESSVSIFTNLINTINSFQGEFFFFIILVSATFIWIFKETLYRNQNPLFQDIKPYRYQVKVFSFFGLTLSYIVIWVYLQAYLVSITPLFLIYLLIISVSITIMNVFKLGKPRDPTEIDNINEKLEKIHKEIKLLRRA